MIYGRIFIIQRFSLPHNICFCENYSYFLRTAPRKKPMKRRSSVLSFIIVRPADHRSISSKRFFDARQESAVTAA